MPLKTVANIGSLENYKKLIKVDAAALQPGAGVAFQAFTKFTFPDKTTSAVILFGLVPPTCTEAVKAGGKGKATGTATVNAADEIELEVGSGDVDYPALSLALGKSGVTRKLRIPLPALTPGNGTTTPKVGVKPTTVPQTPTIGKRPGTLPPSKLQGPTMPGLNPTGNKPPTTGTTNPPLRRPLVKPPQQTTPTNATTQPPSTGIKPTTPPQNKPSTPPRTTPTANKPTGPNQGPTTGPKTPNDKPLQKPLSTDERAFRARFVNLKTRYEMALALDPNNNGLKSIFAGMLQTAKKGDFTGALLDAGKLEREIGKANSSKSTAEFQKKKLAKQEKRSTKVTETLDLVKRNYFKPGNTDLIAKEKLDAGKHFKAFLAAQKAFETARDEKTLHELVKVAREYRKHYAEDFSSSDRKKSANVRKDALCAQALKAASHYQLALDQDKLGKPPWNEEQEMKAAEIYTKLLFEQDEKMATPNAPGSGQNGAFWIEKTVWGDTPQENDLKKTFIFKPGDTEAPVTGFPKGGSVAREMLGKVVGDQLQAMMGLDFDVPETTVVSVDASKLPDASGNPGEEGTPRSGSIQHFAKSKGELKKLKEKDPNIVNTISEEETQKMAILDFVQLNMDRHEGNFMVGERDDGKGGKTARLVPIDNGLCLPSLEALSGRRAKLGPPHAVLGTLPSAQNKMSPEMVAKVQQIDPDAVVAGMKKSFAAMQKLHPESATAADIKEENFELVKRSILFLKKAVVELSVAEIQNAYMCNLEEIFQSPPDKMEATFEKVMKDTIARTAATKEVAPRMKTLAELDQLMVELRRLGWAMQVSDQAFEAWVRSNPVQVSKILKGKTQNPAALKLLADLREELKDLGDEKLKSVGRGIEQDVLELKRLKNQKRIARAKEYGDEKASGIAGQQAVLLDELGGNAKVKQLDLDGKAKTLEEKVNLVVQAPYILLGGDEALAKILKNYKDVCKTPFRKYQALVAWKEYQALGGDQAFFRLGGDGQNEQFMLRLDELKSMLEILAIT